MESKPSLSLIIPTYKRLKELKRCIYSIYAVHKDSPFHVNISIYNNDPDTVLTIGNVLGQDSLSIQINIVNRPINIGPRENFNRALVECHQEFNADLYAYLSDDDYILPSFFESIYANYIKEVDAVISSCIALSEPDLSKNGYALRSHTYRCVPTRPYLDQKLQFIIDSRLMSGTVYRNDLVERFCNYFFESLKHQEFIFSLWYPMAFIASFSINPSFSAVPSFVHAQGNKTFWGEYEAFNEFFIGRLEMFSVMLTIGNISRNQYNKLVADFVAHQQSFKRIIHVLLDARHPISLRLSVIIRLLRVLSLYRVSYALVALSKRLLFIILYTLRV